MVFSDYVAGCTLLDIQKTTMIRDLLNLTEDDKIQASVDVTEAVYF